MTTTEIVWLAGLLEGEGSFHPANGNSINISLGMTDKDVIKKAAVLLGNAKVYTREVKKGAKLYKTCHQIHVAGNYAAGWMMTLYPYMGTRRKERIREMLSLWKSRKPRYSECVNCEHKSSPHYGLGMCKACYQRDWYQRNKAGVAGRWR